MFVVTAEIPPENHIISIKYFRKFRKAFSEIINHDSELWEEIYDELGTEICGEITKEAPQIYYSSTDNKGNVDDVNFVWKGKLIILLYEPPITE